MTCPDCGAGLGEVPVGKPCPTCGGTRRAASVRVAGTIAIAARISIAGVTVRHPQVPTWQSLWAQIDRRITRLRDAYNPSTPAPATNAAVEDDTDALLLCLFHLRDWLEHDATLPTLTGHVTWAHVNNSTALSLAADYSNTFKHHTRRPSEPRFARLHESRSIGDGTEHISVQFWDRTAGVDGPVQSRDALDLAEACRADWVALLTAHNIPVP